MKHSDTHEPENSILENNTRSGETELNEHTASTHATLSSLYLKRKIHSPYANNFVKSPYRNNFVKSPYQNNFVKSPYGNNFTESPNAPRVHAKLKVSSPHDPSELEADRKAEQILNMKDEEIQTGSLTGENNIHAKSSGGMTVDTGTESRINSLNGGRPLPDKERFFYEVRFGSDLSGVRVHDDSRSHELAESINSRAFTKGTDIIFGEGEYRPGTDEGKKLLAHELVHVEQGGGSINRPAIFRKENKPSNSVNKDSSKKNRKIIQLTDKDIEAYIQYERQKQLELYKSISTEAILKGYQEQLEREKEKRFFLLQQQEAQLREIYSFVVSITPYLSELKDALDLYYGKDILEGRELSDLEKKLIIGAAILPFIKGKHLRIIIKHLPPQLQAVLGNLPKRSKESYKKASDYIQIKIGSKTSTKILGGVHARLQNAIIKSINPGEIVGIRSRPILARHFEHLPAKEPKDKVTKKYFWGVRKTEDETRPYVVSDLDLAFYSKSGESLSNHQSIKLGDRIKEHYKGNYKIATHGDNYNGQKMKGKARQNAQEVADRNEIIYIFDKNGFIEAGNYKDMIKKYIYKEKHEFKKLGIE